MSVEKKQGSIKLKLDGELDLVDIPNSFNHETALQSQLDTIAQSTEQIAQLMQPHITKLKEVNKKLRGKLFTKVPSQQVKNGIISSSSITRVIERNNDHDGDHSSSRIVYGHLLVASSGFHFFELNELDEGSLESGLLITYKEKSTNTTGFYTNKGSFHIDLDTCQIKLAEANAIINQLIEKRLDAQKEERARNNEIVEKLREKEEDIFNNDLDLPEIPSEENKPKRSLHLPNFLKKKKN